MFNKTKTKKRKRKTCFASRVWMVQFSLSLGGQLGRGKFGANERVNSATTWSAGFLSELVWWHPILRIGEAALEHLL